MLAFSASVVAVVEGTDVDNFVVVVAVVFVVVTVDDVDALLFS